MEILEMKRTRAEKKKFRRCAQKQNGEIRARNQ